MPKINLRKLGSSTAKGGFQNEDAVVEKFNDWKNDADAQKWLRIMGYDLKEIEKVVAVKIHGYKTDVQVQITIYLKKAISAENLSVKLVSNPQGFNQVDKRWVDTYAKMWDMPPKIITALKLFTGEIRPNRTVLRDSRRMFLDEMDKKTQKDIIEFFKTKKILIVSDILKGTGKFSAGWMLVALKKLIGDKRWVLKSINHVLNVFGNGEVAITNQGSLRIGRITMQRKGGDAGRETSKMLQFKINPVELFGK
jgi:hypothetical protein